MKWKFLLLGNFVRFPVHPFENFSKVIIETEEMYFLQFLKICFVLIQPHFVIIYCDPKKVS